MWVNVKNTAWTLLPFVRKWATQPENQSNLPIYCSSQAVMHLNVLIVQALWPYLKDILLEHFPECCLILPEVSGADLARLVSDLLQAAPPPHPPALDTHGQIVRDLHIPLDLSCPPPWAPPALSAPAAPAHRVTRSARPRLSKPVLASPRSVVSSAVASMEGLSSANEDTFLLSDVDIDSLSEEILNENFADQNARLVCLICYKIFGSQEHVKYKEHMTQHTQLELKRVPVRAPPIRPTTPLSPPQGHFVCDTCGRALATQTALTKHQRSHAALPSTSHQCDQCHVSFMNRKAWQSHLKTGLCRVQSRTCEVCQKVLVDKTRLSIHMRIHSGHKPFQCPHCAKRFSQKRSLTEHELVHEKIRRFKCGVCDRSFVQKNHFKYHMASVHNQLPEGQESPTHSCGLCGKFFAFQFQLKKHEDIHVKKLEGHFQALQELNQ
ncbi:hypothetical protein TCAL_01664 [Tigriopus californicus]|uniref:C2H2-type domain-containing protein n=1 Tax=Tigriopus californicus TaxID=6832 RepID=A0A553PA00_TIGCA|nr:fez family zinc finger protein 1-like [Tigriopus californicus]TRY74503.1 hypothetical protein TCAL_01664 [Tigriopus californicus]|eukprot:TCALIF_01664-PA protein Name:"Similar to ZNF454 Zinc finger protein 454 (Homo sapiens)" AED:0.03 eAED:0.04 QI:0/-1/0/1/-1/1/1/0/436